MDREKFSQLFKECQKEAEDTFNKIYPIESIILQMSCQQTQRGLEWYCQAGVLGEDEQYDVCISMLSDPESTMKELIKMIKEMKRGQVQISEWN